MKEITQVLKLSLLIFLVPFLSINACLLISVNYSFLDNTIFAVDFIGRSNFTIPYIDGSLSISRASRTFPQYFIFKPAMIITGIFVTLYWYKTNIFFKKIVHKQKNFYFRFFGIISAIFLILHSIFLGIKFDLTFFKFLKRVFLLGFIIFEISAQTSLIYNIYKYKSSIQEYFNINILRLKMILVFLLIVIALASLPILGLKDYVHFKHALEWNYFIGIISFYLLTRFFWKKTT
tara:strand:- start:410 stop:1111 length:702 start_codon:yes stop_codon:yes gene_type:complete